MLDPVPIGPFMFGWFKRILNSTRHKIAIKRKVDQVKVLIEAFTGLACNARHCVTEGNVCEEENSGKKAKEGDRGR